MSIRKRVILTCSVLVGLSALLAIAGLYSVRGTAASIQTLSTDAMPGLRAALELQALTNEYRGNCWKHIASTDPAVMAAVETANQEVRRKLAQTQQHYEASITQEEDRQQFSRVRPTLERFFGIVDNTVLPISRTGKNDEAAAVYTHDATPAFAQVSELLRGIAAWNIRYGDDAAAKGMQAAASARNLTLFLAILTLAAGGAMAYAWSVS